MDNLKSVSKNVDDSEIHAVDLEQALSIAGMGWYNIKYSMILVLFVIAVVIEPVGYSYVLPAARCDLIMTDSLRGFIASVPYIGIIVTSFLWGYLVDTRGRKPVLIYSSLASGVLGVASGFMPEIISYMTCKFLMSFCLGCAAATPYAFIGEILPKEYRDLTLSMITSLQILGTSFVPLVAWIILPLDFAVDFGAYDFKSWRLLTILYALPFIICALLMLIGPESPKYLISQGKHEEAMEVLRAMYASNKSKSPEDYPVKQIKLPEKRKDVHLLTSLKVQSVPLMKPPHVKWMALNGFLLFGLFTTMGFVVWAPEVLNQVLSGNSNPADGLTVCEVIAQRQQVEDDVECDAEIDTGTFMINSITNIACSLLALIGSISLRCIRKKTLLVIVFCFMGILTVSNNFITIEILSATIMSSFPTLALVVGPINAYSVDLFPTPLRGMAVSLTMMVGRVGCVVGINLVGFMINQACPSAFYSIGVLLILCGVLSYLLPNTESKIAKKEVSIS